MAISTIQVLPHLSPRIIKILDPVTVISVQDLTNQIKDWEDEPSNLSYPVLVSTAGKESLGGGISVGITAELQNAHVMFEARTESDVVGVYTGSGSNTVLVDDNAAFGYLNPGDTVINMVTGAVATIISIDSGNSLTHEPLDDGSTNTWSYGDDYKIWNKIQCEINGGNLVAVDNSGIEISAFLPSAFTHVIRTSASSATLQEQADIQFASFQNGVWVDTTNGTAGTEFPTGTPRQPVNNIVDAASIATTRGFTRYIIIGDITFGATDDVDGFEIVGEDINKTTVTLVSGVSTRKTEFMDCELIGDLSGAISVKTCHLRTLTDIGSTTTETVFKNCVFETGTFSFLASGTEDVQIIGCSSGVPGSVTPIFDHNSCSAQVLIRNWNGGIEWRNMTVSISHSCDMSSGQFIAATSCTAGTMILRGVSLITDNSASGFTLDTSGTVTDLVWDKKITEDRVTDSYGKKLTDTLKLKRTKP